MRAPFRRFPYRRPSSGLRMRAPFPTVELRSESFLHLGSSPHRHFQTLPPGFTYVVLAVWFKFIYPGIDEQWSGVTAMPNILVVGRLVGGSEKDISLWVASHVS
jgi:hypothetical protein